MAHISASEQTDDDCSDPIELERVRLRAIGRFYDSVTISTDGWYPCKPPQTLPDSSITSTITFDTNLACPDHPSWESTKTTKINVNVWPKQVKKVHGERCRRHSIHGVEIRDLPRGHLLHGEQGLFATKKFQQFDIVGEYNGKVVLPSIGGHYVACLEDGVLMKKVLVLMLLIWEVK